MAKAAQHHAMARQWELLKRLPSRAPGITARELVDQLNEAGFAATKRTIERDLVELSSMFGIECNDKGTPFGWYWMRGQGADMPGLSVADAVSTRLVEDLLMPLLPPAILEPLQSRFEHARHKLAAMEVDQKVAAWSGKVRYVQPSLPMVAPVVQPEILEVVQKALMGDLELLVTYRRSTGDTIEGLMLHPQAMIQRGQITYVVAMAFGYDDVRLYALHRMEKAETNFNPCRHLSGFDVDAYLQTGALQFASGVSLKLKAWVDPELAGILRETPLTLDQRLQADSSAQGFQLNATVQDTWQLWWWILGQGLHIQVKEPHWMVNRLREHARGMVDLYKDQFAFPQTVAI